MQDQAATIRLIVPTRNCHRLLGRLVDSLQQQTLQDWRVCFIDASSDGETPAWLESLCCRDPRFSWQRQRADVRGIFGAMNQGFALASPQDWLLFWGSDDWAAAPGVLAEAMGALEGARRSGPAPDLLVMAGRYVRLLPDGGLRPGRRTAFRWRHSYRRSLLLGSTPPHQATLIGPGARRRQPFYRDGFNLSADLDYFLRLSRWSDLQVLRSELELVLMGDGGVSGQQTARRLAEVRRAYRETFGAIWPFAYGLRYAQRLLSRLAAPPSTP
jgi:glycosyltransferase involved in cell wall biosynthesis